MPTRPVQLMSAEAYLADRREKFQAYRAVETLEVYLMVDPIPSAAKYIQRTPQGWRSTHLTAGDVVGCLECL